MNFSAKVMHINTEDGEIFGVLYLPEKMKEKNPAVIYSHELKWTHNDGIEYAEYLAERGIICYVFDYRNGSYNSRSGRDMTKLSVLTELADLTQVVRTVKNLDCVDSEKVYVLGASMGGYVAARYAAENPNQLRGLMLLYPALGISEGFKEQFESKDAVPETFSFLNWFVAGRQFAVDAWDYDPFAENGSYEGPVMILQGDADVLVPEETAHRASKIYKNCELHIIPGGVHGFCGHSYLNDAQNYIGEFIRNTLM